jgi:cytochrome d ubiquinol oxidase subunit II
MSLADVLLAVLWAGLTLYAVLGGADFGAGVLHLLTPGTRAGRRLRRAIATAMGPVWEANHVWLIFFLTGLLTVFPGAFAALGAALFAPATIALLGIVVRGAAFAFAGQLGSADRLRGPLQVAFGVASAATPFVLGATAAGIASERPGHWLGPFELVVGGLAVAACAALAATFLCVEMQRAGEAGLARAFRARAVWAAAATAVLAALGFVLSGTLLTGRALPALAAGSAALAVALAALRARRDWLASTALAASMAAFVWGWGLAQYPRLAGRGVTVASAAAPAPELHAVAIALVVGAVLLAPSLWLLYVAFRRRPARVLR